jgi:Rieske Fe-S protein
VADAGTARRTIPVDAVPVGGGKIIAAHGVVVAQPSAGVFAAFSTTCTHLGCTVRAVAGGTINCFCHGSRFRITDGSVAGGPALRPLPPVAVTVADGLIERGPLEPGPPPSAARADRPG